MQRIRAEGCLFGNALNGVIAERATLPATRLPPQSLPDGGLVAQRKLAPKLPAGVALLGKVTRRLFQRLRQILLEDVHVPHGRLYVGVPEQTLGDLGVGRREYV
jgi:hypothetical protein